MPARTITLMLALLALLHPAPVAAQATGLPPLSFLGFQAGASLGAVGQQIQSLGGQELRCIRAKRDRTVQDCRTNVMDPGSHRVLDLWLSAIDSSVGVLMLSSPVTGVELDLWRSELETAFGSVGAKVQGPQWMLQWVRQGQMLRLTWRVENGRKLASVSLIDGKVLDGWGMRKRLRAMQPKAAGEP